jgi:hypothetical protein
MSRHHAAAGWSTISAQLRPIIKASLPQPCVNPKAGCPGLVEADQLWDVAHRGGGLVQPGADVRDVGAAHRHCNRSAGGKVGASITNAKRKTQRRMPRW